MSNLHCKITITHNNSLSQPVILGPTISVDAFNTSDEVVVLVLQEKLYFR